MGMETNTNTVQVIKSWAWGIYRRQGNAHRVLVGRPDGRPGNGWEDSTKMDLQEVR
jgi:hypothetical protein